MKTVFACPYNALTPELEDRLAKSFRAYRAGRNWVNPVPSRSTKYIGCWSDGPGNADANLESLINKFLDSPGGWLVAAMHGLDQEGWGPLSSGYLRGLLGRLVKDNRVEVIGPVSAMEKYGK